MPGWLRDKRCIYALDTFDDNPCICRCLAIYKRFAHDEKNRVQKRNSNAALNLAREYYGDNNLKKRDVRPTKLLDFEGIARHHNVNIMLYEPKKHRREGCRIYMAVSLRQGPAQKQPARNKHGIIRRPLFLY